jgi:signal transduction histidine kinase
MRSSALYARQSTRRDVALLLAASIATVVALTAALIERHGAAPVDVEAALLSVLLLGAALAAVTLVWRTTTAAHREKRRAREESSSLRRHLAIAEAVIKAEPQVLVFWDEGRLQVVTHSLAHVAGLPRHQPDLLLFGQWLEPKSAGALKGALEALFERGRSFSLILRTRAGGHLEADGRAAAGRAVLRLRDVAGYKRDLGRIMEVHQALARDIGSARALLDALPMPVWLKGRDGRLTWVNKAYAAAVEAASEAEVIEKQLELLESRQRLGVSRALAKGEVYRERLQLIVGKDRKAHDVIVLALEEATAGAAIDVAELESAQGELDRQGAAYDRTLDRVATAVAIFSREQRLTFYNEAYLKLWELEASWLDTHPTDGAVLDRLRELGRLPDVAKYSEWKRKVLEGARAGGGQEDWWHLADGRILHVISEQRPDGGVTYLYADETQRFALESRYNALIRVQRETLDSLKEGVAVFDTDGRLKLWNSAFAQIWKLSPAALAKNPHVEEVISLTRVLYDDPGTWSALRHAVTSFSEEREQIAGQMLRPDDSVINYAATPLPDGATLLAFADVTDRQRYERALVERNEALVATDRLKNQFISHVSYELRTPLQTIIGFSDLLANPHFGALNNKQREYLSDIVASSKTLLAIIDDILDLATIDAGSLELKLAPVDLAAVIDAAVLGVHERAARARLTLDIAIAEDADSFVADESRVRQVLYNLLSNAVGFSRTGDTVKLTCWREAGMVVFCVEDRGVGIPKEQQARLFERFESRSHGSGHRGAGLGLSIVRSLVEAHGGEMALHSEPGLGTRVTVRFPERGAARAPARAEAERAVHRGAAA